MSDIVNTIKEAANFAKEAAKNVFMTLFNKDVSKKIKEKNKLKYLSWASAWAEVKKSFPDATFKVYEFKMANGNPRFWFDDGHTGWVKVGVTIEGLEHIEDLPIMDFRNQAIAADKITSVDANKSMKRCLTKACALHGLALHIFEGEDLAEEVRNVTELQLRVKNLVNKKVALSDKAREQVGKLCKDAEREANPDMLDELITGNYTNIDDSAILETLEKNLAAIRK